MIELGLSRVFRLLAKVPLPWRAIHVAGTNGKGSICAYVSGMLSAYNASKFRTEANQPVLKHGRFNSPHLIDRWDCITIDGETISEFIFHQVEARIIARNALENIQASEFEILTATAFEIFTQEKVDIGVIEVGMGGRLDATNVLGQLSEWDQLDQCGQPLADFRPAPLVTAVSTIALDHQGFLGSTLEQISTEKAGIMKPGVPVVLAPNVTTVVQNLLRIAKQVGVSEVLHAENSQGYEDLRRHSDKSLTFDNDDVRRQNSAMAFSLTWLALQQLGRLESKDATELPSLIHDFHAVPANTIWPGRVQDVSIERITGFKPLVLLDGAHNAESAASLANTVAKRAVPSRSVIWVIAASQGKDIKTMLRYFLNSRGGSKDGQHAPDSIAVIATTFGPVDGMPWVRSMSPAEIVDQARAVTDESQVSEDRTTFYHTTTELKSALQDACDYAVKHDAMVVVAGSLYLVGDVLRMIRGHGGKIR